MIGSYVAVGDSFTEGVGDPGPDGALVGWADRFAVLLADRRPEGDFNYTNLAVRGKLLDQIMEDQLTRAVELAPDLVSFCAGGNDILRPGTDPDEVAERFERAISALTAVAGTVMVTTGFDTVASPCSSICGARSPRTTDMSAPSPTGTAARCSTCGP